MFDLEELKFDPKIFAGEFGEKDVAETEELVGHKLPPEFIEFLKKYNGGIPEKKFFRLGENTKVIDQFLAIISNPENNPRSDLDIGYIYEMIEDRLDENLVPFCLIFPGDYLCFDYEKYEEPDIVLWNHDRSEEDAPEIVSVADDFEEFLTMLIDEKEASK